MQGGSSDTELSDRGKKQSERLSHTFSGTKIDAIYSSPLSRALYTAEQIARPHNMHVTTIRDFREMEFGTLEGETITDINGDFMRYLMKWHIDGGTEKITGGESLVDMADRAWTAAQRIISNPDHQTIILVSHYFITLGIICRAIGLPLAQLERLRVAAASISTLNFNGDYATLLSLGETQHLDGV